MYSIDADKAALLMEKIDDSYKEKDHTNAGIKSGISRLSDLIWSLPEAAHRASAVAQDNDARRNRVMAFGAWKPPANTFAN